jgi:hypothetical protein
MDWGGRKHKTVIAFQAWVGFDLNPPSRPFEAQGKRGPLQVSSRSAAWSGRGLVAGHGLEDNGFDLRATKLFRCQIADKTCRDNHHAEDQAVHP